MRLSATQHQRASGARWKVTCAHGWQHGGGLFIDNTGTATLTDTNVYASQAGDVCSPFELSSSAPLESLTLLSRLVGWGTLHLWHGDADQHQRLLESG